MVDDLRYAVRSLLSSRGFTVVTLLIIALSIGAITPIFSTVDAVSLRPLPYPDSDRLVIVRDSDIPASTGRLPMSQRNFLDWEREQRGLDGIGAYRSRGRVFALAQESEHEIVMASVTGGFFSVLSQVPSLGRPITEDDVIQQRRVAVISHRFWQGAFGGRTDVLGKTLTLDEGVLLGRDGLGAAYEIVGVAKPGFLFPAGSMLPADAFVPLVIPPAQRVSAHDSPPFLTAIGRLGAGLSLEQAQNRMEAAAAGLRREYPQWSAGVALQPYHEHVTGRTLAWMRLLLWGVVLVFVIMCANVANLLLARAGTRRREIGVRAALGASRRRIVRQLLTESLLLAAAGTAIGLLIGWWLLDLFRGSMPAGIPRANEIAMDWRVLAAAAAAALVTGGVFGLAPAVIGTRVDLSSAMKSGGAGSVSSGGARLRSLLIVGEVAAALVLLVGALLFVASFLKVTSVPLGVDHKNVVLAGLNGPALPRGVVKADERWAESARYHGLAARIVERVRAVPGVEDVAAASGVPFSGGNSSFSYGLPGRPGFKWSRDQHQMVAMKMVSPNYLQLLRVPLIRGRYLDEGDGAEADGAVVLSESAARMIWPGEDPIGQEINLQKRLRVVGIVSDVRMAGPEAEPYPDVYVPLLQGRGTYATSLVIRTALPAGQMLPSLRAAIQEVDPSQRVREATTLEAQLGTLLAQRRFNMLVVGSFGALAVLIAAIGIYGVIAYLVTQRTHEIGVRMALGASRGRVLRLVLGRAAVLVGAGLIAGAAGVWYFSTAARAFLFELDPLDPRVIAMAAILMVAMALLASLIPARRAASVDPLIALRQD